MHRHPRQAPAVFQVTINGPMEAGIGDGPVGETPSRKRIFARMPESEADEEVCAEEMLVNLMRRAYRKPVSAKDLVGR